MKKFYILWVLLGSPVFAMESAEKTETQSWLPKWENVKTYMGFGISCETKIPSQMPMKAAYGVLSMVIGFGEIYTANQLYTYNQSPPYSASNIPAFMLTSHGTSTFFHGGWTLLDVIPEMIMGAIFGKSHEQEVKDGNKIFDNTCHLGLQLLAATGLVGVGVDIGMKVPHFLLVLTAAQISEKFIFKDAFKNIIFDQSTTPFNRIYHGLVSYTAALAVKKLTYHPHYASAAVNYCLLYAGTADIAGGVKDTIFLIGRVWSNLKLPHDESKKFLPSSSASLTKTKPYNPRPFAKKKGFVPKSIPQTSVSQPKQVTSKKGTLKAEPSLKSFDHAPVQQQSDPILDEEPKATKTMLPTWLEERQQLLRYGIIIESGPYGETILRCGDITKTVKSPLRDEAKISGKKAETIRSMLSMAWENVSNTYSMAIIAMHADLRSPHHYVFQAPCEHKIISALENGKSYKNVSITRNELKSLLNFLDSEERKERKHDITGDQDLGYYFDASKGDGSHAMYSLGRGMGGITLCKPKNGRNPDELTPEQVKDLKMALIQKGLMLNSDS